MSTLKVDGIRSNSASSDAITLASDGTCTANITNKSNHNIIINGACLIAQRSTSSTTNGYGSVDRFQPYSANTSVTTTHSQVAVTSGGAYDAGFRKAFQVTKPAGSVAANGQIAINYAIEGQDIVNSGWKMTDPNSKLTLSFWVKSSVSNHNPTFYIQAYDTTSGTEFFNGQVPALTADTWTKVTTVIPGHANIGIANDNTKGMVIGLNPWYGTDFTDAGNTNGAWTAFGTKPVDSTWLTTNASTFQYTGVQLEVGDHATDFEHRSYGQELALCKRYYNRFTADTIYTRFVSGQVQSSDQAEFILQHPVTMRAAPTFASGGTLRVWSENTTKSISAIVIGYANVNTGLLTATTSGCTRGTAVDLIAYNDATAYIEFISEL